MKQGLVHLKGRATIILPPHFTLEVTERLHEVTSGTAGNTT